LSCAGFGEERQKCTEALSEKRFRAHYGVGQKAIKALIKDMKTLYPEKKLDVKSVLMGMCWLRLYETEEVMAGRWGYGEKHIREVVREYVQWIGALKEFKITFKGLDPNCKYAPIDDTHVRVEEFKCDPSSKWYSHKFNGPGLGFEAVCDPTNKGRMLWAEGPHPAAMHDITTFRGGKKNQKKNWKKDSLYHRLPDTLMLVGDSAYSGQTDKITTTMDGHAPLTKKLFARMKSMQESCFKRLKQFKVLGYTFRHGNGTEDKMEKMRRSFNAVAVLTQYDIENGHPLFEV